MSFFLDGRTRRVHGKLAMLSALQRLTIPNRTAAGLPPGDPPAPTTEPAMAAAD